MPEAKKPDAKPLNTEQVEEVLLRLTKMAKTSTVLVGAIVVLIAAVVGGYYDIQGIIEKAALERAETRARTELTRDQAKAAAGDLATDVETLSAQMQQAQDDIANLREYLALKGSGQSPPPPATVRVRPPLPPASASASASDSGGVRELPPEVTPPAPIELKSEGLDRRFKD
jgi:hypothetical protein